MVRGQQIFSEHFKDFKDCYIAIGGLAVDAHMDAKAIPFRATKDFDIILVIEALRPAFFEHFWKFIQDGKYQQKEVIEGERQYYRFKRPENEEYPAQIELFSKLPDAIPVNEEHHLVPIPATEDISSLSAILMDEDYYMLTKENVIEAEGMSIASPSALICLKAKAYLDLKNRKEDGQRVDSREIKKHKNDVFRISVTLAGEEKCEVPESILADLNGFINELEKDESDISQILKNMGISTKIKIKDILDVIKQIFSMPKTNN